MRCLMCGKEKGEGDLYDILNGQDPLCHECRKKWRHKPQKFLVEGIEARSSYRYNDAYASALIQFKECGDEALKDVFLFEVKEKIRRLYKGYTICLMPSSKEKLQERGFSHLYEMFSSCHMPMLEPFVKDAEISQKGKSGSQREAMQKAIHLKPGIKLPKKILLADDVYTTGSTIRGALSCIDLRRHQIRIYVCAKAGKEK